MKHDVKNLTDKQLKEYVASLPLEEMQEIFVLAIQKCSSLKELLMTAGCARDICLQKSRKENKKKVKG